MNTHYAIKRPTSGRLTFAVIRTTVKADRYRHNVTVSDPRIKDINAAYVAGHQTAEQSLFQLREVVQELKRAEGLIKPAAFSQTNLNLIDRYWAEEYSHLRLKDPASIRNDLCRAVRACGHVPVASGSRIDLQKAINRSCTDPNKQRRVVQRVNELLRWLKRDIRLEKDKEAFRPIRYLTIEELTLVSQHLTDDQRALVWGLFGTGCRVGELFALTPATFSTKRKIVHVMVQRRADWSVDDTKTRRHPKAPVIPEALPWLEKWVSMDEAVKKPLRLIKAVEFLRAACMKALPDRPEKWCHMHDLRHSYACHMLRMGIEPGPTARAMGITDQTFSRHYAGLVMTDEEVDVAVNKLWDK